MLYLFPQAFSLTHLLFLHSWEPYIYDIHTEVEGWGVLEICHMLANSIVFKQYFYCLFLREKGVQGIQNWSYLCMTPLTENSVLYSEKC